MFGSVGSPYGSADGSGECFDDLVVAVVRDEDAGLSAAGLSGVEHSGHDEIVHDGVEIDVVEDDASRLPTQFEGAALDLLTANRGDDRAGEGGAGEGHLVDIGVSDQVFRAGAVGRHDIDHTVGDACLLRTLADEATVQRRLRGGLEHHGGTGGDDRPQLHGCNEKRHVPRDDAGADTDRLFVDEDPLTQGTLTLLLPGVVLGDVDVLIEHHGRGEDLDHDRLRSRRADLGRDRVGELLRPSLNRLGEARQRLNALVGRPAAPFATERCHRTGDGSVNVSRPAVRNRTDDLLRRRVDHGDAIGRLGRDVFVIDKDRRLIVHATTLVGGHGSPLTAGCARLKR